MKEADKSWLNSPKLQIALGSCVMASAIIVGNFHNTEVLVKGLDICGITISAVVVSRASLNGWQSYLTERRSPFKPSKDFVASDPPQEESR